MDQAEKLKTGNSKEECNDNELDKVTAAEALVGMRSKREKYNHWIKSNFHLRECICYMVNPEKDDNLDPECHCGHKKSTHSEDAMNNDSGITTWTADQCTRRQSTNAYGEVQFQGTGTQHKSPYVRLSDDTDATLILDQLMLNRWLLKVPNLVISVTGGAKKFELNSHLKEVFGRGLMKAAKSTGAWIITGGSNDGVMKHVGEAVKEHQLMLGTEVKVIGIASWGQIQNKKALMEQQKGQGRYPAVYSMGPTQKYGAQLDPNHTHFILVDNGTQNWGVEIGLRSRVEEAIMKQKIDSHSKEGSIEVPVVLLVLEGGINTIRTMFELIKKKVPAVVIDGSGRAANVVAFAYSHTIKKEGQTIREIDSGYEKEIKEKLYRIVKEYEVVNSSYDMIKRILEDETMVSIYRLDNGISQDIDLAILKALLKANRSSKSVQLDLALAWNRIDLAKSDIFTENMLWTTKDLSKPMFTALLDGKSDFVELFLRSGLNMKEFLNTEFLCKLYAVVPVVQKAMKEIINMQMVGMVIDDLMGGMYTSQFSSKYNYVIRSENDIYLKRMQQPRLSMPAQTSESSVNDDDQIRTPYLDVFIWAVLCNRRELARVLWEGSMQRVAAALMACKLLRSLAKKAQCDETNTDDLLQHALSFEERAIGVLDECFKAKEKYCQKLLVRELEHFGKLTCLDLAVSSHCENFISHTVCQRFLYRLWMSSMTMSNSYKKIVLCIFLPFLIPLVLSFVDDNDCQGIMTRDRQQSFKGRNTSDVLTNQKRKEEYSIINEQDGEEGTGFAIGELFSDLGEDHALEFMFRSTNKLSVLRKVSSFYSAPITKFVGNVVSNLVFIVLYAYVLMMNFPKFDSSKTLGGISVVEILLYFWVFSIFIEECRQVATETPKVFFGKVCIYLGDPWNWNTLDILSIAAFFIAVVLRFSTSDEIFSAAHIILTVGIVLFIARSLQMFFVNRHLGPRLVMIGKMMKDLMHFVFILLVFIVAYGISLEAVMFPGPGQYARNDTWKSIQGVLELPYWQMYGELFLDEIKGEKPDDFGEVSPVGQWVSPLLLALFMLVANVLLLNLLIAIFSNTFQGIQDASDKVWKFQRYDLIHEYHNKPLFPPPLILISHVFEFIRWICRHGSSPPRSSMKLILENIENEQIDNWEVQAANIYTQKQKDTSGQIHQRLKALEERLDCMATKYETNTNEMLNKILKLLEAGNTVVLPKDSVSPLAFMHHKARSSPYPRSTITRFEVPDDKIDWNVSFPDYDPVEYTAPVVLSIPPWADPDLMSMAVSDRLRLQYNEVDSGFNVDRKSYTGTYKVIDRLAMNPMGRTGIKGRGLLGRFGPNHAADPIVTRWKQTNAGVKLEGGKKVLEFVAILRKDSNQWAIPGGMVEPGIAVSQTLKSEFGEEALAKMDVSPEERKKIAKQVDHLFQNGDTVYKGYVDDPRNTDNAWMETLAVNFHDDQGELFRQFKLQAGDDAAAVRWQRVSGNIPLYASHTSILEKVAKLRDAAF